MISRGRVRFPLETFLHFKYAVFVLVKANKVEVQVLNAVLVQDVRGLQKARQVQMVTSTACLCCPMCYSK